MRRSVDSPGFFRGCEASRVDAAGRVVIPVQFRRRLEEYGPTVLATRSLILDFPHAVVYPISVWNSIEAGLYHSADLEGRKKMQLLHQLQRYSLETQIDERGRIVLPPALREYARLQGEVLVVGYFDTLQIWSPETYTAFLEHHPVEPEFAERIPY